MNSASLPSIWAVAWWGTRWRKKTAEEIRFRKRFIFLAWPDLCERKFRKPFHLRFRQRGSADLVRLQHNVFFFFHFTCVRTSPKSFYRRWTLNYNAQFPMVWFLSLSKLSASFLLIPTSPTGFISVFITGAVFLHALNKCNIHTDGVNGAWHVLIILFAMV